MMRKITYSDIEKRIQSLSVKNVVGITDNCRLYYDRLEESNTLENAKKFISECAKDSVVASYYMEDLQKYTDEYYKDPTIKSVFENQIIPMITIQKGDTVLEGHQWEDQFKLYQVCDRIIDNMQLIESKMPIDETMRKLKSSGFILECTSLIDMCCEAVCRYKKLDLVAKVNIALEESMMLIEKYYPDRENYDRSVISRVLDNISVMEDVSQEQLKEINLSLVKSPVIDFIATLEDPNYHNPILESVVSFFQGDRSVENINEAFENGLKKVDHVLELFDMVELAMKSSDCDLVNAAFGNLKEMPSKFMDQFENTKRDITLYRTINDKFNIRDAINKKRIKICKECGSEYTEVYEEYQKILEEAAQEFKGLADFIYPEYNAKMIREGVFAKAKGVISLMKASEKLGGIVNNLLKARKWIKGKAQPMKVGKQITDVIKTVGSNNKMLTLVKKGILGETASIYEYLTPEGDFDAIVDRYIMVDEASIDSSVLDMFDNICREMNDNIFHTASTDCGTYFLATEDMIEVHYFDNERVELTEEEAIIVSEQTINNEFDMPLIYEFALYSSMPDDICELNETEIIRRASDTLLKHKEATMNDFNTFLELASYATIWHDTVGSIFESVCEDMPATFRTQYEYAVEHYRPVLTEDEIELEALDFFKDFINEKVDYDKKYGKELEEDEDQDSENNDEDDDPKKEAKKKVNPGKDNKDDDKPEKKEKMMSFNNIKLFQMGLKKKMKDLNAKEQGFCRNLDGSFSRLVKSMQQALVSDRREAIIKGSVIPSLSKAIKWGCAIAGTAIINPIAPVVTAIATFAMSKRLTKKERTLLLDDIEIELKVIDKEIGMAESDNNTKKMRALMKEQRNLQRQYQRIKYNIRVGKDLIPGGTGGKE